MIIHVETFKIYLLCTVSLDSHIESKTSWFIASHDAYHTFVIAYMTSPFFFKQSKKKLL